MKNIDEKLTQDIWNVKNIKLSHKISRAVFIKICDGCRNTIDNNLMRNVVDAITFVTHK